MKLPNLATIGLSTKIIAGLSLALFLSLGGNALLIRAHFINKGEAKGAAERDVLAANVKAAEIDAAVTKALAVQAKTEGAALAERLQRLAEAEALARDAYEEASKTPLPLVCHPGKGRITSVNDLLGPQK